MLSRREEFITVTLTVSCSFKFQFIDKFQALGSYYLRLLQSFSLDSILLLIIELPDHGEVLVAVSFELEDDS